MDYSYAIEERDKSKINKLNSIISLDGYWDTVRKFTKNVKTDHTIKRWQCLADIRFKELQQEYKDKYFGHRNYLLASLDKNTIELVDAWIYGVGELPINLLDADSISAAKILKSIYNSLKAYDLV